MNLLHVRHATSILEYAGIKILIDPVLAEKETYPAIPLTPNKKRNPLVDLRTPMETFLGVDCILCTHTHNDHFDEKAYELLDKNLTILCQEEDVVKFGTKGFHNTLPIKESLQYQGISIIRVTAQHGCGITGKMMGTASGYVLQAKNEPTVYISGDTIYNNTVKFNIEHYHPQVLIMNAGSPKFLNSDRIVMNIIDIENTIKVNPKLTFVVVHLDTFNHCIETRADILEYFTPDRQNEMGIGRFLVPQDNEFLGEEFFLDNLL
jgi:hypothetical protein